MNEAAYANYLRAGSICTTSAAAKLDSRGEDDMHCLSALEMQRKPYTVRRNRECNIHATQLD